MLGILEIKEQMVRPKINIENINKPHSFHTANMEVVEDAEWLIDEDYEDPALKVAEEEDY